MSGHSKWSKVKHQKGVTDAVKSAAFTKVSRAITVAVAEGGGITDPARNFHLRLAMENARAVNMPKDTIVRAVERATASSDNLERFLYEGYGPGGVAVLIEGVTDNKQRATATIKHLFDQFGGSLAGPGAVSHLFSRIGVLEITKSIDSDTMLDLVLDAGAQDVEEEHDRYWVYTKDSSLHSVSEKLKGKGMGSRSQKLIYVPRERLTLSPDVAHRASEFISALRDAGDVTDVTTNL